MVREIIIPTTNAYTIQLPDSLIGKEVEVLAFEVQQNSLITSTLDIKKASTIFKDCKIALHNYKFNRDEANDYE